ncbi:MAG: XrtA/PEP-CTERM system TPR-repeat protein PrsT [Gammaproteobacteria bacterium]
MASFVHAEAADETQSSVSSTYEDGLRWMNDGDVAAARIQFKNALQTDPNYLPARIALGLANLREGDARGAEKELRIALSLGAARGQVFPILGNALLAQRKYEEILQTIKSADPASDGGYEVVLLRARAQYELGRLEEAARGYERAAVLASNRADPLTGLAQVELAYGKVEEALKRVERALELEPSNVEGWYRKGEILRVIPDYESAIRAYDAGLAANPGSLRLRQARASMLLRVGRLQHALDDARAVNEANPKDISALYLLWEIHQQMGDTQAAAAAFDQVTSRLADFKDEAILEEPLLLRIASMVNYTKRDLVRAELYLKRYVELRPNDRTMLRLLGRVQLLLGDANSAIASFYPLMKQNPADIEILVGLGRAFMQTGRYGEARAILEKASGILPDDDNISAQLALSRVGQGAVDDALQGLKTTAEDGDPGQSALLLTLLQFKMGDRKGALSTIEAFCDAKPNDARAQNLLGVVQSAEGDLTAARKSFDTAAALASDYVPPLYNLAKLDIATGQVEAATRRLERIVEQNPRADAALMALADIMLAVNDRKSALQWLDKAAAAAPDAVNTQVRLIEMQLAMGQTERAMNAARLLVDRNPENALGLETLANVQLVTGKRDLAARNYRTAARYAGYDGPQLMRVARRQVELEDYSEAKKTLLKATGTGLANEAETALVRLDTRLQDYESAMKQIDTLREKDPQSPTPAILLGELHLQRKELPAALASYEKAQANAPSSAGIAGIADVLIAKRDYAGAVVRLQEWTAEHPYDLNIARKLASTYLPAGEFDKARALHESLLEKYPDDPMLLANLARLYQLAKDERARSVAERAVQLAPKWPVALDTLGWVLVTEGQLAEGLELLREALARQDNPLTRYHLAQALSELGRNSEAQAELKIIIRKGRPEDLVEDARRYLASIAEKT